MIEAALVRAALLRYAEEELDWGSFSEFTNRTTDVAGSTWEIPGLGTCTLVAYHDYDYDKNYDGWAEEIWQVWEVQGTLYKVEGSHTSYTGTEWENTMTVVVPKTKTVTYYEEN